MSRLVVMMYHYVRGPLAPLTAQMYGPTQDEFARQLDLIQSRWTIVSYGQVLEALVKGRPVPERSCLITFDDGTIDQYCHAFPELRQRGISAVFFVITETLVNNRILSVHARHILGRRLGEERLQIEFRKGLRRRGWDRAAETRDLEAARHVYRWDTPEMAAFKYALNFGLPRDLRDSLLAEIYREYIGDPQRDAQSLYMNREHLSELAEAGMIIGGHSHRHEALALLPAGEFTQDLRDCANALASLVPGGDWPFSYPFGKQEHFSPDVQTQLKVAGFSSGFTNIQEVNAIDAGADRYALGRFDPKDLPQIAELA